MALLLFFVVRPLLLGDDGGGDKQALPPPSPTAPPAPGTTTTTAATRARGDVRGLRQQEPLPTAERRAGHGPGHDRAGRRHHGHDHAGRGGDRRHGRRDGDDHPRHRRRRRRQRRGHRATRASQRVALLDVYQVGGATVADVRVNSTVYTQLAPGEEFAGSYKVVSLEGTCGSFLFGDERFRLCKGEEVLK